MPRGQVEVGTTDSGCRTPEAPATGWTRAARVEMATPAPL